MTSAEGGRGFSVFDPPQDLIVRCGLSELCETGESILWVGAPSRLALAICGLPRQAILALTYFLVLIVSIVRALAAHEFSDRLMRVLMLLPFLIAIACFVVYISLGACGFVYAVTSRRLVIKPRPNVRDWKARLQLRRFNRLAGARGLVDYAYREATTVTVRRWFFDIGNIGFRAFARPEPPFRPFSRPPVELEWLVPPEQRPRAPDPKPPGPKKVVAAFKLFPGANYGAGWSPSASMAEGFFGVARVREVAALIGRQLETAA